MLPEPSNLPPLTPPLPPVLTVPRRATSWLIWLIRFIAIALTAFSALFSYANYPSLVSRLTLSQTITATANKPSATLSFFRRTEVVPDLSPNQLHIPRLELAAPVQLANDNQSATLNALLLDGVIHLAGSALPGEIGNVVIAGHSSSYVWDKRQHYGNVFAGLPALQSGDLIWVRTAGQVAGYAVVSHAVVKPTDVSILAQSHGATITLFTCYPIGTTWNRYVIVGRLIWPNIAAPSSQSGQTNLTALPTIR